MLADLAVGVDVQPDHVEVVEMRGRIRLVDGRYPQVGHVNRTHPDQEWKRLPEQHARPRSGPRVRR